MEEKVPLCLRLWQRLHIDFLLFIGLTAITEIGRASCRERVFYSV